ncbi:HPr family phosphocarrier protein [Alkalispirochaeta alkalica]|uniref:HPr family phosphocarrier protein n=1 Tax=Alkalispirochaeta alkalica TaxID=46356 RepID=UPI00035FC0EF|nr:hypothetical protein [Alkalispirochaeta alkalica]
MKTLRSKLPVAADPGEFSPFVECACRSLARLCRYVISCRDVQGCVERAPLGIYIQETRRLEELLDAFGARDNAFWAPFRSVSAAAKLASDLLYKVLHLKYAAPFYALFPLDDDFLEATDRAARVLTEVLAEVSDALLEMAREKGLSLPDSIFDDFCSGREVPPFLLPGDRECRLNPEAQRFVADLATAFLNQVESSGIIGAYATACERPLAEAIPHLFCERQLRRSENEFHNLQAEYDTALAGTRTEQRDKGLPYLRGHATVIFHLLELATALSHYYERHVIFCSARGLPVRFLGEERIRELLFDYALNFSVRYLAKARDLCRMLLQKYAEIGSITVPIPVYRGFHVRPSSLVAKIVLHYGTEVTMELDGETCDASSAMDIIRFNEKIHALKRRRLAEEVATVADRLGGDDLMPIFLALLEEKKIILYAGDLQLQDFARVPGETIGEYANRGIARLLATGKIDICSDITVTLRGDLRVLEDIRTLARHGYGEDSFGNNIALPASLIYLRR